MKEESLILSGESFGTSVDLDQEDDRKKERDELIQLAENVVG